MSCIARLISNYPPTFYGAQTSKYGRSADGDAVYRAGPPRDVDRLPIIKRSGPLLPIRSVEGQYGPASLAYELVQHPNDEGPGVHSGSPSLSSTSAHFFVTVDILILNLCCGHRRPGDVADVAAHISFPACFRVWFIGIDIVSSNDLHNLADDESFGVIIVHVKARRVHAKLGPRFATTSLPTQRGLRR